MSQTKKEVKKVNEFKEYLEYVKKNGGNVFAIRWKMKIMPQVYGWGAAVVLVGALFKLTHWLSGNAANVMLAVGLGVEAVIFILSSFEKPHIDPDWSRLYSEFNEDYCKLPTGAKTERTVGNASSVNQLDDMLNKANINEETLKKLSASFSKLNENASQMANISNAVAATNKYAEAMEKASKSVGDIEKQLQSSVSIVEANNKLNKTMSDYIEKVNSSAVSADALNKQMNDLSKRMTALNNVYGNMLSAMNVNVK